MGKVKIIAEAGVNHNGSVELAKELIIHAKECDVDYVKFQTFITDLTISKSAKKTEYQAKNTKKAGNQYKMVKKLELSFDDFILLKEFSKNVGVGFLTSGFDNSSLDFINSLNLDYFKIPSGEITNKLLLEKISKFDKPILLSTGMSTKAEIQNALDVLFFNKSKNDIILLHCNTEYPTPFEDVNLFAINDLREHFKMNVGFSDHTIGIEASLASVMLGVTFIEKHFTLDKSMKGPDHSMSLNPAELKNLVSSIRNIEKTMLGSGSKKVTKSENKNLIHVRKSLFYDNAFKKGIIIKKEDLIALRPGDGISPMNYENFVGKKLISDVNKYEKLKTIHFGK